MDLPDSVLSYIYPVLSLLIGGHYLSFMDPRKGQGNLGNVLQEVGRHTSGLGRFERERQSCAEAFVLVPGTRQS